MAADKTSSRFLYITIHLTHALTFILISIIFVYKKPFYRFCVITHPHAERGNELKTLTGSYSPCGSSS